MDVKSRLGCELSQFPATVGGVRTAQTFATALIHSPPPHSPILSGSLAGCCQAEQKAVARRDAGSAERRNSLLPRQTH